MRERIAVRLHATGEIMALDRAGKSLADGGSGHINDLAGGKHVDFQFGAGNEGFALTLAQAKFVRGVAGGDIALGEVAGEGLGNTGSLARPKGHLNGTI